MVSATVDASAGALTTGSMTSSTGSAPTGAQDSTGEPPFAGCPDPLPADWVLCEDFEDIKDPAETFALFSGADDRMRLAPEGGRLEPGALLVTYLDGQEWNGQATFRFGEGPGAPNGAQVYRPDERFDEVWVQMHVRTQAMWPDGGYGHLFDIGAVSNESWASAYFARVSSEVGVDGSRLIAAAYNCVDGPDILCNGAPNDTMLYEELAASPGMSDLFVDDLSAQWHCIQVHVALGTPGQSNGVYELSLDGQLEFSATNLDYQEQWGDNGFNELAILGLWSAPSSPEPDLVRAIDEVIVSTAPVGCV